MKSLRKILIVVGMALVSVVAFAQQTPAPTPAGTVTGEKPTICPKADESGRDAVKVGVDGKPVDAGGGTVQGDQR